MIEILSKLATITRFIEQEELLKDRVRFCNRRIFIEETCIAELEDDGCFRSRDISGYDFFQLKTIYKFLTLCQTFLTIESKEVRKMQETSRQV